MIKEYKQLSIEERSVIAVGIEQGLSKRAIALLLNRPPSTVVREILRNSGDSIYRVAQATAYARKRKRKPQRKLDANPKLWQWVREKMQCHWSPQKIAGTLKLMPPDDPENTVSHETIYAMVYAYPRGELRTALIKSLRQSYKTRKPRARGVDRRGQLQDITEISHRPMDVEDRKIPGHWEGDLISG
jgi:IS30 family transposase